MRRKYDGEIGTVVRLQDRRLPYVVKWPAGYEVGYAAHEIRPAEQRGLTLSDALRAADTGGPEFLPIRRAGWVAGLRIWYSRSRLRWLYEPNAGDGDEVLALDRMQGCLTPDTMLAEDWELVE